MKRLNILGIELDSVWQDKTANLEAVECRLKAMPDEVDLVILPEMFSTGFVTSGKDAIEALSERNIDDTVTTLARWAKEYNVGIMGTFIARTNAKIYNRAFFIEPSGDEHFYDKVHLFSIGNESEIFSAGTEPAPVIRFRGWNIMPVICYDLRFPVFTRNVANKYDLLVVMANWPKSRAYPWHQLLVARAIENLCYVCGINRCGIDGAGLDYGNGSSVIVDYKGTPISASYGEDMLLASLSSDDLDRFREKFPAYKDADSFDIKTF